MDDKISNLPDDLLHRILLFLPTKQVVATSVLSKRWVRLWTLVPTLDFDDADLCRSDVQAKMKFMHFVYRVLLLNKARCIEKFRLLCYRIYGHSCVQTWIFSAMERDLQEVDILANEELLKLPSDLFLMKKLKILKLNGKIMVDVPVSVCFPRLKVLHLLWCKYANAESIRCFISGCLSLEELHINAKISPENMVNLNISTPTLKTLYLALRYEFDDEPDEEKIEINAPALKYLNFTSWGFIRPTQYFVENLPCSIEANIIVPDFTRTQLLRALGSVKCLRLTWHLDFLVSRQAYDYYPLFANLTRLELHGAITWPVVALFVENSPKLEYLLVDCKKLGRNGGCWRSLLKPDVPTSFLSSLSRVCFENFEALEEEMEMVEYLLAIARELRTMEFYTNKMSLYSKLCFLEKLSTFPRSSDHLSTSIELMS
ncbi:hypothetical protein PTKIN_Ptkin14bG0123400 [Pterospermum kingtungense]